MDDYNNFLNINDINNEDYLIHHKPSFIINNNYFSIINKKEKKFKITNMNFNYNNLRKSIN
jgi:hypothetical protein